MRQHVLSFRFGFDCLGESLEQLSGNPQYHRPLFHQRKLEDRLRGRLRDRRRDVPLRKEDQARDEEGASQVALDVRAGRNHGPRAHHRTSLRSREYLTLHKWVGAGN